MKQTKSGLRLGNSGKGNTGKKYLNHNNLPDIEFTDEDLKRIEKYNSWYTNNKERIITMVTARGAFDEDIFQLTYTRTYNNVAYGKLDILDYASYFCRAYFTNFVLNKQKENRYTELKYSNNYLNNEDNSIETVCTEVSQLLKELLIVDIREAIEDKYVKNDKFRVINLYYDCKHKGVKEPLKYVSEQLNIPYYKVQRDVAQANLYIKKQFEHEIKVIYTVEQIMDIDRLDFIINTEFHDRTDILEFYDEIKKNVELYN